MPYTTIPTLSSGNILTASHMNTLSSNAAFLKGLSDRVNTGFNTFRATTDSLTSADAVWYIRHKHDYLHYKIASSATANHIRLFFNGTKYAEGTSTNFTGYVDLTDLSSLPNLLGAWNSGTTYDNNTNGNGDVVTNGGSYYRCIQDHTNVEPGVAGSWSSYWVLIAVPTVNTWCNMHVTAGYSEPRQVTVEYLLESPATSI